jgi:CubicO group peptidase (beta-lactamase class C family)
VLQDRLVDAAGKGETENVQAILAGGAPVDGPDVRSLTAYQSAKLHGRRSTAEMLLSKGANAALKPPDPGSIVDRTFESLVKEGYPGATVLVARDGKVLLRKAYGMACLEHRVAATPATRYRIGSITKQFTSASVMRLVQAGKVSPDDSIAAYVPNLPAAWRGVTVRELLNHTSGIPSYTDIGERWQRRWREDMPPDTLVAMTASDSMWFAPGTQWRYDNSGYVILGMLLDHVTGTPYPEYIEKDLLRPLGLDQPTTATCIASCPGAPPATSARAITGRTPPS